MVEKSRDRPTVDICRLCEQSMVHSASILPVFFANRIPLLLICPFLWRLEKG